MLKQDLQEQIKELKSQLEFSKDLLEKKIEDNFSLRQQIIKLEKQIDLPISITKTNNE
tara:strand:+ start:3272 stop:3445 length:174 start_codon:yes stop_codon:yes gene_type:complete